MPFLQLLLCLCITPLLSTHPLHVYRIPTTPFLRHEKPSLIFHLPRFCRSQTCITRALSLLRSTCKHIQHFQTLNHIRASCPTTSLPLLFSSRRFNSIHPESRLNLFTLPKKRAFLNITHLSFHRNSATATPKKGHSVPLAQRMVSQCSRRLGESVTVYVIDTGCRTTHEQLSGRVAVYPAPGSRFSSGEDDHGHGTHVAATIAGRDFGLAPRARLVCIKALSERNEGSGSDVMSGIQLALRLHTHGQRGIISISLGVRAERRYRALDNAIEKAARAGIVSVVAAGNSGRDACTFTPARAASALTVAAVGRDGLLAQFSNWGRCVVVGAPGVGIWSAVARGDRLYGMSSGTSMAAPFVSGLVALRLSERGGRVEDVKRWLWEIGREREGLRVVSVNGFCRWMKRHRYQ